MYRNRIELSLYVMYNKNFISSINFLENKYIYIYKLMILSIIFFLDEKNIYNILCKIFIYIRKID